MSNTSNQGYGSPVYAANTALEDILTKRRNEARQVVLDAQEQERLRAEQEYRNANLASLKLQRESQAMENTARAKQLEEQEFDNRVKNIGWKRGSEIDPSTIDPTFYGKLQERGYVNTVKPQVTTSESLDLSTLPRGPMASGYGVTVDNPAPPAALDVNPPPPTPPPAKEKHLFVGSRNEQAEDEKKVAAMNLLRSKEFLEGDKLTRWMMALQLGVADKLPPGAFTDEATKHSPIFTEYNDRKNMSPEEQRIFDAYMDRDANRHRPAAGVGVQPTLSQLGTIPGTQEPLFFANRFDKDHKPVIVKADGTRYTGAVGAKPSAAQAARGLPAAEEKNLTTLRSKATPGTGIFGYFAKQPKAGDIAAYKIQAMNSVNKLTTNGEVASLIGDILADAGYDKKSTESILAKHKPSMSPEDYAEFERVLRTVR